MENEKSDEEVVAKSGESDLYRNVEDSDPWANSEMKHLKGKWSKQELEERIETSDKELAASWSIPSLSHGKISTSAKFSPTRSSHNNEEQIINVELVAHEREPCTVLEEPSIAALPGVSSNSKFMDKKDKRQSLTEYFDILVHLALFGIFGVLIRYGLEVLFDDVLSITHELTIVYRDLPANMVGSFFMGWVGIVLKKHIHSISEPLGVGLSTGLMGSITTYAGWNQKMVVLLTSGNIAASLAGLLLGMSAAVTSLLAGIDSAKGLQQTVARSYANKQVHKEIYNKQVSITFCCGKLSLATTAFAAVCLWGVAFTLLMWGHFSLDLRILWFACLVAPLGVWLRWHLARLNGRGVHGKLKWLPLGTLLANLIGAGLEGILAFLELKLMSDAADLLLGSLQLGFIGCLSTVSTFVAEVYTMHVGGKQSKAYVYTFLTLFLGLILSIFLYSTPSWALGNMKW